MSAPPDPRIAAFFEAESPWQDTLAALRELLRGSPLEETFKWSTPCYTHDGGNIAAVWRMKAGAALAFFRGALLPDPEGILAPPGPNSRAMRRVMLTSPQEVTQRAPALGRAIDAAIQLKREGRKIDFAAAPPPEMPDALAQRLAEDPALKAAFEALTPGRRRGYALHIGGAKKPETRATRMDRCAPRILDGKGLDDR